MEPNKRYARREDMSPDGELTLLMQPDGDIIVVAQSTNEFGEYSETMVEFCEIGSGGGRSHHTRKALVALAEAIEKDNKEKPIS